MPRPGSTLVGIQVKRGNWGQPYNLLPSGATPRYGLKT